MKQGDNQAERTAIHSMIFSGTRRVALAVSVAAAAVLGSGLAVSPALAQQKGGTFIKVIENERRPSTTCSERTSAR